MCCKISLYVLQQTGVRTPFARAIVCDDFWVLRGVLGGDSLRLKNGEACGMYGMGGVLLREVGVTYFPSFRKTELI